ncbi:MAG: metallophosphoesterase family protein [Planctomycetota bacterium]
MRTLAIGNIHGQAEQFASLLQFVELKPSDRLITLGDYVDRGPDSRGVIEQLIALHQTHNLVTLRGNHDMSMADAQNDPDMLDIWRVYGAESTLRSYGPGGLADVTASHWTFLNEQCQDLFETDTHIFVHGFVAPDQPLAKQEPAQLHWTGIDDAEPHPSGKTVICGHRPQEDGRPLDRGFGICLDTTGWLTCMDVDTTECWQIADNLQTTRRLTLRG